MSINKINNWLKKIQNLCLPTPCFCCGRTVFRPNAICDICLMQLPWHQTKQCIQCAHPLRGDAANQYRCGRCLVEPPVYGSTIAPFSYQSPVDRLIIGLKFKRQLSIANLLGNLLLSTLVTAKTQRLPQLIIPVPLHPQRLKERGFNQALEIARPIAKQLRIPIDARCCQRIKSTLPQAELSGQARAKNVHQAFRLTRPILANHVVIVDDVMTTGHTCDELARELSNRGAKQIDIWCVARTPSSTF